MYDVENLMNESGFENILRLMASIIADNVRTFIYSPRIMICANGYPRHG